MASPLKLTKYDSKILNTWAQSINTAILGVQNRLTAIERNPSINAPNSPPKMLVDVQIVPEGSYLYFNLTYNDGTKVTCRVALV